MAERDDMEPEEIVKRLREVQVPDGQLDVLVLTPASLLLAAADEIDRLCKIEQLYDYACSVADDLRTLD